MSDEVSKDQEYFALIDELTSQTDFRDITENRVLRLLQLSLYIRTVSNDESDKRAITLKNAIDKWENNRDLAARALILEAKEVNLKTRTAYVNAVKATYSRSLFPSQGEKINEALQDAQTGAEFPYLRADVRLYSAVILAGLQWNKSQTPQGEQSFDNALQAFLTQTSPPSIGAN